MKEKIWLSSPHMGGNEQKYIDEAFAENWVAPLGPNVNKFENDLKNYLSSNVEVAALSAGTAALHLGLILLGVQAGDEVLCQSMTFSASANPIVYQGATPIFIDSEPTTWNICPQALEDAIKDRIAKGKKPKAIVAVHLYGMPYQHKAIKELSQKYEIPILEDAAEALGSIYYGEKCGTLGDLSVLSFNGNKIITTSGGGALVCHTQAQKEKAIFLATQARDEAPHYQHSHIGYNYRMSNIVAGIGCGQMEVLAERVAQRRANNIFYAQLFSDMPDVELLQETNQHIVSNHWLSAILLDSYEKREQLRLAFAAENIESRPLWKPMHLQPIFAEVPYYGAMVAEDLFTRGLCLPSGSNLTTEDRERIKKVILSTL